jgi:hypothetical protein
VLAVGNETTYRAHRESIGNKVLTDFQEYL